MYESNGMSELHRHRTDRKNLFAEAASLLILSCTVAQVNAQEHDGSATSGTGVQRGVSPRIIGGLNARESEGGWMAALLYSEKPANFDAQFCGGTVIHPEWILTAAHCVDSLLDPSEVDVLVGTRDLRSGGTRIAVDRIIMHPDYNDFSLDSDIALLHLAEPVPASVPLMRLIENGALAVPGTVGTVLGWGLTSNGVDAVGSPTLLVTTVPIISNGVANRPDIHDGALTENMLSAGQVLGGRDSCQGDSGGPLVIREPLSNRFVQAGITSFGPASKGCGDPDGLGAYTRVSKFRSWIYGYVFPDYLNWENANTVTGENRDADRDGATNWAEYAALTNPKDRTSLPEVVPFLHVADDGETFPAITFPRRSDHEQLGISYQVRISSDLINWEPLSLEALQTTEPQADVDEPLRERVSIRGPLSQAPENPLPAYFQVYSRQERVRSTGGGGPTGEILTFPGVLDRVLDANSDADMDGKRYADYQLANSPAGTQVSIALRSAAFNASLSIFNAGTGELLLKDQVNSGGGGRDELITFQVALGIVYRIRVSTFGADQFGAYSLRAFSLPFGAPLILAGSTRSGSLIVSDSLDPLFLPLMFRKDDYLLRNTTFRDKETTVTMTSDTIDPYLSVINSETGAIEAQNDDIDPFGDFNSRVVFNAVPGIRYIIRATTGQENQTGTYRLVVD
ncbi:MAG: secreted trypsin-like serine protease [Verrucomicrobiales bacterium]